MLNRTRIAARGLAAAITLALAAAGGVAPAPLLAQDTPVRAATVSDPEYVLGADDKVHITVFGEDHLTGDYSVTSGGVISFPLIGNIPAAGRNLNAVQEDIRGRLASGYLRDPKVALEVSTFRSLYVLGEVNKPGEYPFRTNLTLEQAVAAAGGFTYRANKGKIYLRHVGQQTPTRVSVSMDKVVVLQPGDTVSVGERFF
jgi:polysaccharide export outer membrane protein